MCVLLGAGDFTEGGRGEGVEGGRWAGSSWVGVASSLVCSMSSSNRDIPKISPLAIALLRKRGALEAWFSLVPRPSHTAFFAAVEQHTFFFYGCKKKLCGKAWVRG